MAVIGSALGYLKKKKKVRKLVKVDISKVCLGNIVDLLVLTYSDSQLKIRENYVLPLCEQLCIFAACGYVQTTNNQNENCIK